MIAVIFEFWPKSDKKQKYLDLAAALRPSLERIDGFISIERFESLTEPGKMMRRRLPLGAMSKITAAPRPPGEPRSSPTIGYVSLR